MGDKPIKSVQRVFEILELFDMERRPIPAREVAKRLGYPLMSAHELLKSMHMLGYADFDPDTRCYTPAFTLPIITHWVQDSFGPSQSVIEFMQALNSQTRETINLSRRIGRSVKISYGIESKYSVGVSVKIGTMMPLGKSLTGLVALCCLAEDDREIMLARLSGTRIDHQALSNTQEALSKHGFVMDCDIMISGIGALCMPITLGETEESCVIGIVGPSDRIRDNSQEHRASLISLAQRYDITPTFPLPRG